MIFDLNNLSYKYVNPDKMIDKNYEWFQKNDYDGSTYSKERITHNFYEYMFREDLYNIVDFENYDNLTKYGNNLYKGEGGFNSNNYSIKQKYLEGSNVDSINEIAMMMETVNEFEANQKVIQTIDSILGQIASDIGRVK